VDIAGHLEPLANDCRIELDLRKNRRIRPEENLRPASARRTRFLRGSDGIALLEPLFPLGAITANCGDQLLRQRVDHARADAVETARCFVVGVIEFSSGVQYGEDDLECALFP
jgi:hypothetical protein